ncbi:uncharacterized protein LOC133929747 [Phragmites australis]|uniref:uncharacterized protein LOC133929747 n=1 Tax=Phragmites australis TaxID=29695 RepID=UPI002D79C980|nr:uncharacterized protein LOC133929747 [Phragmites australis]
MFKFEIPNPQIPQNQRTPPSRQLIDQSHGVRPMGMEAKCGGLAVAAGAVRRPLQPRDTNVAPSTVVVGKAPKPKMKAKVGTRPAPQPVRAECGVVVEVSLAEELEKARERRGRLRSAREQTEREMEERAAALDREAAEWERRSEEQRKLVAELMRLIGMPDVYTPVESLRSKEERKRREAVAHSGSRASTSIASILQAGVGAESCSDQESEATAELAKATVSSS